ncbi:MAG: hypothetical protein Q9218_006259 [Villophora microphyllina]
MIYQLNLLGASTLTLLNLFIVFIGFTIQGKAANMPQVGKNAVMIEDIRTNEVGLTILEQLRNQILSEHAGEKTMPTLLLYDEQGLKLFEEISYLDEYYLTNAEIEVLQAYATSIAELIPDGCVILELGSGYGSSLPEQEYPSLLEMAPSKPSAAGQEALMVEQQSAQGESLVGRYRPELQRTLSAVPAHYRFVRCHGLLGTYDDGLHWLKGPKQQDRPKWILSLGSSIGNFTREEATSFLEGFANAITKDDAVLIGLDSCQDGDKIYHAYNDGLGKTHQFVLNGLVHANRLLDKDVFQIKDWQIIGEYDQTAGRHQAFYCPVKDVVVDGVYIRAGTKIRVEESYKYSSKQSDELWRNAGLVQQACFGNSTNDYYVHMLARPSFGFPLEPAEYATQPVPSLGEWTKLWAAWDLVTQQMIPSEEIHSKPIKLRNCCIFYLGHIPTFLDIHLTRATESDPTKPSSYHAIFERGIDPDVDNPEKCHAHSEIPDEWPPLADILGYQARVRSRVKDLMSREGDALSGKVGRALWLGFEHEGVATAMHLETLLYMLLQSDKTLPPPGPAPDFQALAQNAQEGAVPNEWIKIPPTTLDIGLNDPEDDCNQPRYFGWDNEKPRRKVEVAAFEAKARPLTNEDYVRYLCATDGHTVPASWVYFSDGAETSASAGEHSENPVKPCRNGYSEPIEDRFVKGKCVRTVYGPIALKLALSWPVFASYDELASCAKWMNGRIPTTDEVRSIYNYVDRVKTKEAEKVQAKKISAVNGHLSNDGVEETPPSGGALNSSSSAALDLNPHGIFANLEQCNIGLSNFHPTPVTHFGNKLCGRGEMGGVWEWTSTTLEEHKGFKAMEAYPGYTGEEQRLGFVPPSFATYASSLALRSSATQITNAAYARPFYPALEPRRRALASMKRCRKSAELHDKRHREIATYILKIQKIDEDFGELSNPFTNRKRKTRKSDVFTDFSNPPAQVDIDGESDFADTTTLNDDESEPTTPRTPNMKENVTPRGPTKAERRRARHSSLIQIVTPELMRAIDAALHSTPQTTGETEDGASDIQGTGMNHEIIQDNIKFNSHCFWPGSVRPSVHAKKLLKANGIGRIPSPKSVPEDPEITLVLVQLGIATSPAHATKDRVNLVKQLRNAIRDDIEKVDNENRDTMQRMAGYWRYVNRKTYNFMVRNNHIWDWATGQKLEEIEEEDDEELDTEDDHETDGTSWGEVSTVGTPLSGTNTPVEDYSEDYELDGMKILQLVDKTAALDAKLNEEPSQEQTGEEDPTTPKTAQFPMRVLESKSRIPIATDRAFKSAISSPSFPSSNKDTRHLRPSTIGTIGIDVPLIKLTPPAGSPGLAAYQALSESIDALPAAHDDPNNPYNLLKNAHTVPSSISQRRGRATKTLKLSSAVPVGSSPLGDSTNTRATVKGKALSPGKATYAAALKKGT